MKRNILIAVGGAALLISSVASAAIGFQLLGWLAATLSTAWFVVIGGASMLVALLCAAAVD